jgi:hypothetical protein
VRLGMDLILDDNGRVWQTGSRALLDSLHIAGHEFDLTHYLIRNLVFVRFRTFRSGVRITLSPRFLTMAAYEALVFQMVAQEHDRFVIEIIDTRNRVEIVPGLEDAAARLADLATVGGNISREDFYREELSLGRLRGSPRLSPLVGMLHQWQRSRGSMCADLAIQFGDPALRGRVFVMRMLDGTKSVVEFVGDGFAMFDAARRHSMVGQDPRRQPDPKYSENASVAYRETHVAQTPRLEFIEAVIRVPGCPAYRSRYERLLLPWYLKGTGFVSVASVLRTSFIAAAEM